MATMMKEKRKDKKKSKDKSSRKERNQELENDCELKFKVEPEASSSNLKIHSIKQDSTVNLSGNNYVSNTKKNQIDAKNTFHEEEVKDQMDKQAPCTFEEIPGKTKDINEQHERGESAIIDASPKYGDSHIETSDGEVDEALSIKEEESVIPSAPAFEEERITFVTPQVPVEPDIAIKEVKSKDQCMSLEEAVSLFGGTEISEIRTISEKEEAIVEAGPISGPEHPLVDLLSTFRSSLNAMERARITISNGIIEEEKFRHSLWKVEKRRVCISEKCPCGSTVTLQASYEHAELQKEKIPAARMRLESLSREVQDSYCHHQHSALLAYCQIEELVYQTTRSGKGEIREALSLVLQALRLSDGASEAYSGALQRWAVALSAALLDGRDLRQLVFLIQHLFRQTRSVRWASRVIRVQVTDLSSAARVIALLELMVARPGLETAVECTEELEDVWEEVGSRGEGCAVSEGRLRERDALALLRALPLRQLLAKLALFARSDVGSTREGEWGEVRGGRGVVGAACGVRALLSVAQRALHSHPHYSRLKRSLRELCSRALHALAALHMQSRACYHPDVEGKVAAELEACFWAGLALSDASELHQLPTTILSEDSAKEYCTGLMEGMHVFLTAGNTEARCDVRVRALVRAAQERAHDRQLARALLHFLCQTAVKRKPASCKHPCEMAAREGLPRLLSTHPYLHATSLHMLADFNQEEQVDSVDVGYLSVREWRPGPGEVVSVLQDWWQRCSHLVQHLLLQMDYTPHQGVCLDAQLAVGAWLCGTAGGGGEAPEWAWRVVRALRVHRSLWALPLEAPPPEPEPAGLLHDAFALMATSWGHSVPLICTEGVRALLRVARARPPEGALCLRALMRVMRQSPESVALTQGFTEVLNVLLGAGPSLVARAMGRGGPSGFEILQQTILEEIYNSQPHSPGVMGSWLRGLWAPTLPSAGRALLDIAMRAARDWPALDAAVAAILQGEGGGEVAGRAVRECGAAPLVCEAALRGAHARAESAATWPRLLDALAQQRAASQRAHVDNALRQIGISMSAEELVIYRVANAVLAAPFQHPAHLTLWRLFFHLYLQRPPSSPQESTPPVGPMFFSGIIKSRTLGQLKRRVQDTLAFHRAQAELLKPQVDTVQSVAAPSSSSAKDKPTVGSQLFPAISIKDLTGETSLSESDTDSSDREEEVAEEKESVRDAAAGSRETFHLFFYHVAAEKLVREYSRWLEEGDGVRAAPHHADIARFISEQGLDAAWRNSLPSEFRETSPPQPRTPPKPPPTYLQLAIDSILSVKDRSSTRPRMPLLKPPLEDQNNLGDARVIFNLVDKYLRDIEALAKEWADEAGRVAQLDGALWGLVGRLRARRPLPPCAKGCENRCRPLKFIIQKDEWVISTGAEQGILENRRAAAGLLRRLSRPRIGAARAAAALQTLARHVRSGETARRVAERAGRSAALAGDCAPALQAVSALVEHLAERWLCADASACGALVSSWGGGGEGLRRLCSALVAPRRLPPPAFALLYGALLAAPLPPHAAFSYLSRFEMNSWADKVDFAQRERMLEMLVQAAQRWGPYPDPENNVLLELIGVHVGAVCGGGAGGAGGAGGLCLLVVLSARASARVSLPAAFCAHVAHVAHAHAHSLDSNQLGGLLRELGAIWWEARANIGSDAQCYEPYATHTADLLRALQDAFVAAANTLGHNTEQLSWFAWSALREAWAPWVQPGHDAPLLPTTTGSEAYSLMLHRFLEAIQATMDRCPGGEEYILKYVWEWAVHTYLAAGRAASQEGRVQLSALLGSLAALRWAESPWVRASCLPLALQVAGSADKEITSWCSATWRRVAAACWLRGIPDDQTAPHLAALLSLFCSPHLQLSSQTLEEATQLPWWRLPEAALDAALEQFFVDHHNPSVPYHEAPQFRVLISASQLSVGGCGGGGGGGGARAKRARSVSQCVRAAAAPQLLAHVAKHAAHTLRTIADLAPHIESSEGELEELLSRAMVIMCFEPAAGVALPVWQEWVGGCHARLRLACASAISSLTALDYFSPLAEATARAQLARPEDGGWGPLRARWAACVWDADAACAACAARRFWHAAYALLPALTADAAQSADAAHAADAAQSASAAHVAVLRALAAHDLTADDDEPVVAVWVCVASRLACTGIEAGAAKEAGRSLLGRWAAEPRRSLLQVVGIQQHHAARIRVLCRLAQCVLKPTADGPARAYESACAAVFGSDPDDVTSWGGVPSASLLPRLAVKLFPGKEAYFEEEMKVYGKP
ncbi:unnamed protein product, partial [Iphiclides podalirius]